MKISAIVGGWGWGWVMGRHARPRPVVDVCKNIVLVLTSSYLSDFGSGKPCRVQLTWGVGLPLALHLRETGGPGCRVWSMNL